VKPDIGSESRFQLTPPAFDSPVRGFPSEYCHVVWYGKMEWLGYQSVKQNVDMFIRFDRMYERDGWTDGRIDCRACKASRGRKWQYVA